MNDKVIRCQAADDAAGSVRTEGLEPLSAAVELAGLFAEGRITAHQMAAMLLTCHRAS